MSQTTSLPSAGAQHRQRALKACEPCRQRKRKCDGSLPICDTCRRFNYECYYQRNKRKLRKLLGPPAAATQAMQVTQIPDERRLMAVPTADHNEKIPDPNHGNVDDHSILDPEKSRYFDASSAIAFPRLLGIELGAAKAPRLHSFAWNVGIRAEDKPPRADITQLISLSDVTKYADVYFAKVAPTFDFIDHEVFTQKIVSRWQGDVSTYSYDYDPVIAGVVALGLFFSRQSDGPFEASLIEFAKESLQDAGCFTTPKTDLIAAWILRTIYLRCTTRPMASWMASCILMHTVEASGIHKDISTISIVYPSLPAQGVDSAQTLYQRKVFWAARAIHILLSYEYSRPRVSVSKITCARLDDNVNSSARTILALVDLIPYDAEDQDPSQTIQNTTALLTSLPNLLTTPEITNLFIANVAFAAYRRLRLYSRTHSTTTISTILQIGTSALTTLNHILNPTPTTSSSPTTSGPDPWYLLPSIPFHYTLILLSLDTPESLSQVPTSLSTLQTVSLHFPTHLVDEAVQNATNLVRLLEHKKREDVEALTDALTGLQPQPQPQPQFQPNNPAMDPSSRRTRKAAASTSTSLQPDPRVQKVTFTGPTRTNNNNTTTTPRSHSLHSPDDEQTPRSNQRTGSIAPAKSSGIASPEFDMDADPSSMMEDVAPDVTLPDTMVIDWDAFFEGLDWI